jgi:hypothetical protein
MFFLPKDKPKIQKLLANIVDSIDTRAGLPAKN